MNGLAIQLTQMWSGDSTPFLLLMWRSAPCFPTVPPPPPHLSFVCRLSRWNVSPTPSSFFPFHPTTLYHCLSVVLQHTLRVPPSFLPPTLSPSSIHLSLPPSPLPPPLSNAGCGQAVSHCGLTISPCCCHTEPVAAATAPKSK